MTRAAPPMTELQRTAEAGAPSLACESWLLDVGDGGVRIEDFPHPDLVRCPDPVVWQVRFRGIATGGGDGVAVRFKCVECARAAAEEFGDDVELLPIR
ncbi:hypothetical protein [Salinibacterium sp. ZJ454]|uniref:hypothetical protein n=1 Tax=Salinibacterium sp. ZJ454 TaxID=2708339 RepID=UPI00141F0A70|nr:hypothetical protein [Salinibacterium sp. ZJ454]